MTLQQNLLNKIKNNFNIDDNILQVMKETPREIFVPPAFFKQSWEDIALPIHCGQTVSQPSTVAFMTQHLELDKDDKVLEVGTGSGYQTSILSKLSRRVFTIERHKPLLQQAEERFKYLKLNNIVTIKGNGYLGLDIQAPFSKIIVTASSLKIPPLLAEQLKDNGIMIIPIGYENYTQVLIKLKKQNNKFYIETLSKTKFVPLVNDDEEFLNVA